MTPLQGIPGSADTRLYLVAGLRGTIPRGDELLVMVHGPAAKESRVQREYVEKGQSSLRRWLDGQADEPEAGDGGETSADRHQKVPDLDDASGSRFYYFERTAADGWRLLAICAGAGTDDPAAAEEPPRPATCSVSYPLDGRTVTFRLDEPVLLSDRHDRIRRHVLSALAKP